ncbi:MAG: DnaJ domain-containing protein [Gammaproteobacteria bacterium]|nr:DnaJ domain-containing protein [Gammaproteobacteria bacterium]
MKFVDYYKIMGVEEDASAEDIKKAYRRLARKYHPDVSKESNAEAKFKELGEAYEVLKDPEKRTEYDELRRYGGVAGEEFTPPPGWQPHAGSRGGFTDADAAHFSDFFETLFGNSRHGSHYSTASRGSTFAMRGEDIHYRIPVSLEESYDGATRNISLHTHRLDQRGQAVPDIKTLTIKIPKGVTDGQKIRLRGQGGSGIGGAPDGDLYLEVELTPHRHFIAENRDITLILPISPWEAALGATVQVPTLSGLVNLTIPANAKAGQKLRLKGKGLPGKPAGDQYVVLQIVIPEVKSDADRALFKDMQEKMTFNPRTRLGV